ncbi:TPA: DUF975 family protein [Streptococcus suis]|nr:DUF975 family protein [Streptococcus suis]
MFTIYSIREKARQTLNETSGIYQLVAIPVLISLGLQLFTSARNKATSLANLTPEQVLSPNYLISSSLFHILSGLLLGLLSLSALLTLFNLVKTSKKTSSYKDSFSVFNHPRFSKILLTYILKNFFLFLWGMLFYFGLAMLISSFGIVIAFIIASNLTEANSLPQDVLAMLSLTFLVGVVCSIVGFAIYIPQYYAYSQVECILSEQLERDEYMSAYSIIKSSRKLMRGYKFKRFLLDFSFLAWFIVVIITFGLAGFYVYPYYYSSQIHFYEAILEDQAEKLYSL